MKTTSLNIRPAQPITVILADIRLQRAVVALHGKGPRSVYELLREIGAVRDCQDFINQRVRRYAAMSDADLDAVDGRGIPKPPIHEVLS